MLLAIGDSWGDSWMTRYLSEGPGHVPTTVARPDLELATSPAGHDPNRRQPWGSAVFHVHGRPVTQGEALRQYFIDRDGYPVLTTGGRPVHVQLDKQGNAILDASGRELIGPVDVPQGAAIEAHHTL